MALFSLQDGGLLGQYQAAVSDVPEQTAAAAAFSRDDKALCAVAYAGSCIVTTSPWRQKPCAVKGEYVCPKVYTLFAPGNPLLLDTFTKLGFCAFWAKPAFKTLLHVRFCKMCLQQGLLALKPMTDVLLTCISPCCHVLLLVRWFALSWRLSSRCCACVTCRPSMLWSQQGQGLHQWLLDLRAQSCTAVPCCKS